MHQLWCVISGAFALVILVNLSHNGDFRESGDSGEHGDSGEYGDSVESGYSGDLVILVIWLSC